MAIKLFLTVKFIIIIKMMKKLGMKFGKPSVLWTYALPESQEIRKNTPEVYQLKLQMFMILFIEMENWH